MENSELNNAALIIAECIEAAKRSIREDGITEQSAAHVLTAQFSTVAVDPGGCGISVVFDEANACNFTKEVSEAIDGALKALTRAKPRQFRVGGSNAN